MHPATIKKQTHRRNEHRLSCETSAAAHIRRGRRRCKATTRRPLPRVGIFESAGEAACVTTQVAVPLSFCFRGTRARPWQSWCVRRRSDRSCRCGGTCCPVAGPNGSCRWARLRTGSLPVPGHCEALERCRATSYWRSACSCIARQTSRLAVRRICRSPAETSRSAERYRTDGRAAAESGCRRRARR